MAKTNPPGKWTISGATWGTDVDHNTALANLVGDSCLEFKATTPGSNPEMVSDYYPVQELVPYYAKALAQSASIAAGDTLHVQVNWYTDAKAYISYSQPFNGLLAATGTWYELAGVATAPATARYCRLIVGKKNNAFIAYYDSATINRAPRMFHAYRSAALSQASGKVIFDAESYDYGSVYDTTTGLFTAPAAGVWAFTGSTTAGIASGETMQSALSPTLANGPIYEFATGTYFRIANVSHPGILLARGATVEVQTVFSVGGAHTFGVGGISQTFFAGVEVHSM